MRILQTLTCICFIVEPKKRGVGACKKQLHILKGSSIQKYVKKVPKNVKTVVQPRAETITFESTDFSYTDLEKATSAPSPLPLPTSASLSQAPSGEDLNGTINICRSKNPYTSAPCFIINQSFPNCGVQSVYINEKSLPQLFGFIINFLV